MNRFLAIAAALAVAIIGVYPLPPVHEYTNPAAGEFPILGWSAIRGMENQTRDIW